MDVHLCDEANVANCSNNHTYSNEPNCKLIKFNFNVSKHIKNKDKEIKELKIIKKKREN